MKRTDFQYSIIAFICIGITSCASLPKGSFGEDIPKAPDYSNLKYWAALPTQIDSADAIPVAEWTDEQPNAADDVFFIYPTTYTGKRGQNEWNASTDDSKLNHQTDEYPIRYQASLFNGAGKVYAPRYRQAHLNCFFTDKHADATKALDLAYQDVRSAFQYYLEHFNHGRPFIIASHSQGTFHAKRLIREFIDGKPLQKQLIAAYLVGLTVPMDYFKNIRPCANPEETGCFCSWRTFKYGYIPKKLHFPDSNIVVTNPVSWSHNQEVCSNEMQLGGVLKDFKKVYPGLVETCVYEDLLWVNKPKFPGSFLLTTKNYHIADYNFFYADVRHNAQERVKAYLRKG
jgi:hypothetical protein